MGLSRHVSWIQARRGRRWRRVRKTCIVVPCRREGESDLPQSAAGDLSLSVERAGDVPATHGTMAQTRPMFEWVCVEDYVTGEERHSVSMPCRASRLCGVYW